MSRRLRAFSLTEVLLSLVLFVAMGVLVAITLGASARSNHQAGGYLVARTLVASKLSQLQAAGYTMLNGPGLGQNGAKIVDGDPASPTAVANAGGAVTTKFTFTQTNQLSEFFPTRTGTAAPRGTIYLAPYALSRITSSSTEIYALIRATVEVQWQDSNGLTHTHSQTTLIPRSRL